MHIILYFKHFKKITVINFDANTRNKRTMSTNHFYIINHLFGMMISFMSDWFKSKRHSLIFLFIQEKKKTADRHIVIGGSDSGLTF